MTELSLSTGFKLASPHVFSPACLSHKPDPRGQRSRGPGLRCTGGQRRTDVAPSLMELLLGKGKEAGWASGLGVCPAGLSAPSFLHCVGPQPMPLSGFLS